MFWRFNLFAALWAIFILLLTLMPGKELPPTGGIFTFDKIAHIGVFAILEFLLVVGFIKQSTYKGLNNRPFLISLVIVGVLGMSIEICQAFIPDRSLDIVDLAADSTGGLCGILIFYLLYLLPIK